MQVIAKHQIAYRNKLYTHGQVFELDMNDFEKYKNDILLLPVFTRTETTKPLKTEMSVKAVKPIKVKKKTK